MKDRDSFRGSGIDPTFTAAFKASKFYQEIYLKHSNEIIIGIRDRFINLYYNCDSIAKINIDSPKKAIIDKYYTNGKTSVLTDTELVSYYETIKENSDKRKKREKQAQGQLFLSNNKNPNSDWFCVDVEYTKSLKGKDKAEDWRFDIIAITKSAPYRVALIELKYGKGAIKEPSGIRTHIKDFYAFFQNNKFSLLKAEIVSIINALQLLEDDIPESLQNISCDKISSIPEFYFITLDNNNEGGIKTSPKQTMSGYLFDDKRWDCKRISSLVKKEGDYFDMIDHNNIFSPTFLFSKATLPRLKIDSILNEKFYDIERIVHNNIEGSFDIS